MTTKSKYLLERYLNQLINDWKSQSLEYYIYVDRCVNKRKTNLRKIREKSQNIEKEKCANTLTSIQHIFQNTNFYNTISEVLTKKHLVEHEFETMLNMSDQPFDDITPSTSSLSEMLDSEDVDILTPVSYEEDDEDEVLFKVEDLKTQKTIHHMIMSNMKFDNYDFENETYYFRNFHKTIEVEEIDLSSYIKLLFYKAKPQIACNYILKYLLQNNLISEKNIIYCKQRDAEVEIIKNIKKIQQHDEIENDQNIREHFIISEDQDIYLFGFEHLEYRVFITSSTLSQEDTYYLEPSILGNNLIRIGLLIEKSDYFKGIEKVSLSNFFLTNLLNSNSWKLLQKNIYSFKDLLRMILKTTSHKPKSIDKKNAINNTIDEIILDIQLYLSMDSKFYEVEKNFPKITLEEAYLYYMT